MKNPEVTIISSWDVANDVKDESIAPTFPGIYLDLQIPTGYMLEHVRCEGGGILQISLRKRFPTKE